MHISYEKISNFTKIRTFFEHFMQKMCKTSGLHEKFFLDNVMVISKVACPIRYGGTSHAMCRAARTHGNVGEVTEVVYFPQDCVSASVKREPGENGRVLLPLPSQPDTRPHGSTHSA